MGVQRQHHRVQAWRFQDVLLESYRYAPGKAAASEPHLHADYQLCLSLNFPGVYAYRGVSHPVPKRSLSILHPGEKHAASDPEERRTDTHYRVFYVPPTLWQRIIPGDPPKASALPFFSDPVLLSEDWFCHFLRLHSLLGSPVPLLEQESLLHSLLIRLTLRHADGSRSLPAPLPERNVVHRVKAYIEDNYAEEVSLADLSRLVERHPVYLNALFRQTVGIPPHAYQTQVRIDRAKRLLACGTPVSEAAQQVGFYDQSHFGKYFRRYTSVTPARYRTLRMS